jgi:urease accessory protein
MKAELTIETVWKNKSFLKHVYYTPPFKVANITEDLAPAILQLMLMNVSPGILDGDDYRIEIKIKENSSLHLHTQSYQRIFTMKSQAFQSMSIHLEKNASLFFLPHPTVPHNNSNFTAENTIFLSEGSELLWTEIITCGRKGCGEVFAFSKFHNLTEIYHHKKLVVKENVLLVPAVMQLHKTGQWEGYTHQASLIYWNENVSMLLLKEDLYDLLKDLPALSLGISLLPVNGLIIRVLGSSAEQLFDLFKSIAVFIPQFVLMNKSKTSLLNASVHTG